MQTLETPLTTPTPPSAGLTIAMDLDGCWYDWEQSLRLFAHAHTGRPLEAMPPATVWSFPTTEWGMDPAEFVAVHEAGVAAEFIYLEGEPYPGAVEGAARLHEAGHQIHVRTDRRVGPPGVALDLTHRWLERSGLAHASVTVTPDKNFPFVCDVALDDKPENFVALRAAGCDAFLRDHPYNRHVPTPPGRRVRSFGEFVDRVLALAAHRPAPGSGA